MIVASEDSLQMLARQGVPEHVVDVAVRMTECLRVAGDDMADSTGEDLFDDPTSRGQLLYRRGFNRILAEFADDEGIDASTPDNALHVLVDDFALSPYSARYGIDQPSLGGSRTKRSVVTEMQMQLDGMGVSNARRLVLLYDADEDGLLHTALGVLRSGHDWVWSATLYDRLGSAQLEAGEDARSYEEQEEAVLPDIERRDEEQEDRDDQRGS